MSRYTDKAIRGEFWEPNALNRLRAHVVSQSPTRSTKRVEILNKNEGRCYYCETPLTLLSMTIDHLTPKSRGGTSEMDNLMPACQPCNHRKGDMTLTEFREIYECRRESVPVRRRTYTFWDVHESPLGKALGLKCPPS